MKRKNLLSYGIGMIACFLWACNNEDIQPEIVTPDEIEKEDTWIQLQIQDPAFSTYASTSEEYPNGYEKIAINYPIDLYIFNSAGIFVKHLQLPLTQTDEYNYKTASFQHVTGQSYFYAFANALPGQIPEPAPGTDRLSFEKSTFNYSKDSLYLGSRGLVMGTLVGTPTTIGMANSSSPETVYLPIGRIASKVMMRYNEVEVKGELGGKVHYIATNRPAYRAINKATKVYLVGQWEGPFKQFGSQVITPHFYESTPISIDPDYDYPSVGADIHTYTTENTTQAPTTSNATTFLVRYTYIPGDNELYDVNKPDQLATTRRNDYTFYTAIFSNGDWLMYNEDPVSINHPVLGKPVDTKMYEYGIMYYRIPIADVTEKTPSLRYRTIRNHYYALTIKSISALGRASWKEEIIPEVPLEIDEAIEFDIEVKEWEPVNIEVGF